MRASQQFQGSSCVPFPTLTVLAGRVNLGKQDQTKDSYNNQLYSEYQTIYILRLKSHLDKVQSQGQAARDKTCFSIEACK